MRSLVSLPFLSEIGALIIQMLQEMANYTHAAKWEHLIVWDLRKWIAMADIPFDFYRRWSWSVLSRMRVYIDMTDVMFSTWSSVGETNGTFTV